MIYNKLIAADDLHWNEEEQKYIALSSDEIDKIIMLCQDQDFDFDETYKAIQWANLSRVGSLLLKNYLSDKIEILGFENEEPFFGEKNEN